jgi:hypothetical protein
MTDRVALARRGLVALLLIWAGMLIGVSFLASPAKFAAPSLTLPVALDVGRQVFGTFSWAEIGLALATFLLALASRRGSGSTWLVLGLIWLIVAMQSVLLLPVLDERVGMILEGVRPAPAPWHVVYVVLEVTKLIALLGAAWLGTRHLGAVRGVAPGAARGLQR